ncbi:metallophosphoesterase family protein [Desulfococcus sp.]|uniref:metallophosphoesterase family protein n=1 Tax=Desulfococcus sp. TaxID=2025834 RepID=UPI00359341BD
MTGSIYAIGDIHGCIERLTDLLAKIDADPARDQLVFLGDYIDRGPSSYEVVAYLIELGRRMSGVVFLKGNHEEMFARYLAGTDRQLFLMNGGQATLDSYMKHRPHENGDPIPADHLRFFASLRLYYQTEDFIFVHAGLKEALPLEAQLSEDLLWIRDEFIASDHDFGKRVVFGHTPFNNPLVKPNKIGVDTGAVYGNRLTCVKLPEMVFFHA